jgi:hypothetical protein
MQHNSTRVLLFMFTAQEGLVQFQTCDFAARFLATRFSRNAKIARGKTFWLENKGNILNDNVTNNILQMK